MSDFTLQARIKKPAEKSKEILNRDRRQQSCCTRTAYKFCKKNGVVPSAEEMIKSDSDVQNLIHSRANISDTNYWLKQAALKRAAWLLKANEEVREADLKKEEKLNKQLEKLQKKLNKLVESKNKLKEKIKTTREKLSCAKTPKQKATLQYRLNQQLSNLSKKTDKFREITKIQTDIDNINSKLEKIYDRRRKDYTSVFGGKDNMISRCKGNMTHEEFVGERLMTLYSVGDSEHGNRLFEIKEDCIIYKPNKHESATFYYEKLTKTQLKEIRRIIECVNRHEMSVTVSMDEEYVNLTCCTEKIYEEERKKYVPVCSPHRIMGIDVNPEGCGLSICDWKSSGRYNILFTDFFNLDELFIEWFSLKGKNIPSDDPMREHIHNKFDYETSQIAIYVAEKAKYYKTEYVVIEKLAIESDDLGNSVANTKCNNLWKRNLFEETLEKHCVQNGIKLLRVEPDYSSFEGNLIFRKHTAEPDMVLASLEIGRRGFETITQRIEHTRPIMKNIIFPDILLFETSFD